VELTTASPVMKFGDFSFMDEPVADFEGNRDVSFIEKVMNMIPKGSTS